MPAAVLAAYAKAKTALLCESGISATGWLGYVAAG